MEKNEIVLNILGLGDSGVGQTCIFERYTENIFKEINLSSIGLDCKLKNINLENGKIKLKILDNPGKERFPPIGKKYYKDSDALILVYDVTNNYSYDNLKNWVKDIKHYREESTIKIPLILVGNKIDVEDSRVISREQGYKFAKENGFLFVECSAKTGENIENIFDKLVLTILENNPKYEELTKEFKDKVRKEIIEEVEEYIKCKELNILKKYISF